MAESFATVIAFEWLFFGVNVSVIFEMILPSESFTTDVTRIWSLIGMGSLVYEKVVGLGELSVTIFADESLLWSG